MAYSVSVEESEAAVLGAALLSPVAVAHATDGLNPSDFLREAHRAVFTAIVGCHAKGPVDAVTVTAELGRSGLLDSVGGPQAVSMLAMNVPNPAAAKTYVEHVKDASRRRQAKKVALQFAGEVDSVANVGDAVERLAFQLTASASRKGTVDPDDVTVDFYRRLADEELVKSWPSGWKALDGLYRVPEGMLTVVTGLPSSGKSTWLDVLIWRICEADPDFRVTFFSPEQGPPGKHLFSLTHTKLGADPRKAEADVVESARVWWQERVDWIDDDRDNTISDVLAIARVKASQGTRLLVIDPYNNLSPDSGQRQERPDLEIREMLRRLKRFGRETGCSVVIVAHPRQTQTVPGTEAVFQVPTAAHIAGGQEWWNHADAIVCVWRNQSGEQPQLYGDQSQVKLTVQKVRDAGLWGRQGQGVLLFDDVRRRFFDLVQSGVSPF